MTVVRLLGDILSGAIVLKAGVRTFSTSLICSLTAVETAAVAPPPVAAIKEADASTPPPVTITSDSSSASLSAFAEEEAKGGKKKKSTVGLGVAIAFGVLTALAFVAGFVHRKNKKDRQIREAEDIRDAEWDRQRALERAREEEARLTDETFVADGNETQMSLGPVSTVSPSSSAYTAVSLEQQEEGRHQEG